MTRMNAGVCFVALVVTLLLTVRPVAGQDRTACQVLKTYPAGTVALKVGDQEMVAIPEAMEQAFLKLEVENRALRLEIAVKDSVLAASKLARAWYDSTVQRQRLYIADLDSLYRGYRKLSEDYRRLSNEPWLSFSGGLGATGPDHKPAILAGVGIRRVQLWGFLQERNAGGFLGVHLRLF
jgi:hypothetical protein